MCISYISQVLLPSPLGVFLVVIFKCLVGNLTGPFGVNPFDFARSSNSADTFSRALTFREVSVIRILWILGPSVAWLLSGFWNDIFFGLGIDKSI